MNVALVAYDFEEYCIRLANGLADYANVLLVLPGGPAEPYLSGLDSRVVFQPFEKPRLRQPHRQLRAGWDLVRRIRAFNPDVIHLQHGHLWFNGFLPLLRRIPLVLTVHDPRHHPGDQVSRKTPQAVVDFGFRQANRLIVHAQPMKQIIIDEIGIEPDRVHVVPHISLCETPDSAAADDQPPKVLFFGRIWEYKGLEYLIRAEPLITAKVPEAMIVIAGEGEDFGRYRRLMVHPERFVVHNEYVPSERRNDLFRQSSLVVLPYVEASQSGVIPLAYSFNMPVVATTVGGLPEMVDEGRTGYLVPPRNERALADAIVRLLCDKALRVQMGLNGKRKLDAECAPSVVAGRTLAVYHRAIAARASARRLLNDQPRRTKGAELRL